MPAFTPSPPGHRPLAVLSGVLSPGLGPAWSRPLVTTGAVWMQERALAMSPKAREPGLKAGQEEHTPGTVGVIKQGDHDKKMVS